MALFMKEANLHWKQVAEALRNAQFNPTLCLEAARAAKQGMHHDQDLAKAYNDAISDAKTTVELQKIEKRKNKHARAR